MKTIKVGDKVEVRDSESKFHGRTGVVKRFEIIVPGHYELADQVETEQWPPLPESNIPPPALGFDATDILVRVGLEDIDLSGWAYQYDGKKPIPHFNFRELELVEGGEDAS